MVDNSTLYFRIHGLMAPAQLRPRGAEADYVRGRRALLCRKDFTGNSCSPGFHLRADPATHTPCGPKIWFPAQSSVSRSKFRLAPVLLIWIPPFCIFVSFPHNFRFRLASVSALIEARPLSPQCFILLLLEGRHVMMNSSTLYFGIHGLRTNACDHGSGPVEAARSQSGVRTRVSRPFLPEGLRGQLVFVGSRSPLQSYTNHVPYGVKYRFPPKVSSPA